MLPALCNDFEPYSEVMYTGEQDVYLLHVVHAVLTFLFDKSSNTCTIVLQKSAHGQSMLHIGQTRGWMLFHI